MTDDIDDIVAAHRDETHTAPTHLVAQWHAAIDEAAAIEHGKRREQRSAGPRTSYFWGIATMAALALGVALGFLISDNDVARTRAPNDTPVIAATGSNRAIPAAFTRGLQYHLQTSKSQLAEYESSADTTLLILDIVEQNRLFELAAENNNADNVARLLRAFEPILLRLAADDIAPEDADALREQLSFELKVMLTKLAQEPSDQA